MRRLLPVSLLLAGAVLACGGDDALSKEEFIAQGDAVCEDFEQQGSDLEAPTNIEEVPDYIDRAIAIATTTRENFGELSPPDDGEDVHAALVEALDRGIAGLEEAKAAAEDRMDQGVIDGLTEAGEAVEAANEQAREYGFEVCGGDSPSSTSTTTAP